MVRQAVKNELRRLSAPHFKHISGLKISHGPHRRHIRDRQNVVAVLVDNSRSMDTADAVQGQGQPEPRSRQAMAALQGGVLSRIAASSDVRLFAFSDRADAIESLDGLSTGAPQEEIA